MITFSQIKKDKTWDSWRKIRVARTDTLTGDEITIEPGAAYFVVALERLGADVQFSCEGHPKGFYVCFSAPYETALKIARAGFFTVELCRDGRWTISLRGNEKGIEASEEIFSMSHRNKILKSAAAIWEHELFENGSGST